jgi:DNA (cytosine-5)-methyltransferase 1
MAEAGALAIEWAVLDAQYFGVPQRRRRVFVIAIFDPVLAERSPSPLLPVSEGLPGHLAKGKQKRKSAATTLTESTGTDGRIVNAIGASIYHKQTVVNQDVNSGHLVVGALAARDYKGVGNQYVAENKCVVEPFVKSSRAQTSDDSETWIPGEVNPTLNSFDVGDTRATTAIVEPVLFENSYRDGARIAHDGVSQTLTSKMGTGGGNTPMLAFGIQGNVIGRQDHNGPAGKGHTEDGDPMFTLTSTDIHAVAYPIDTRNALRDPEKYDAQNRQGLGIGNDGDPMATLTSAHVNGVAVQYDGYNQRVNETDVSLTIRIGRDSSDFIAQPTEPTVFQPGTMVRLGGGVWEGTVPTLRAESKRGDNEPHILVNEGMTSPTLTAYNMDSRSPQSEEQQRIVNAVFESTMAVRRLTPLECEKLMGWPPDHTRYKADGTEQADTHRYKQCGNGVASPVAQWIAKHILAI